MSSGHQLGRCERTEIEEVGMKHDVRSSGDRSENGGYQPQGMSVRLIYSRPPSLNFGQLLGFFRTSSLRLCPEKTVSLSPLLFCRKHLVLVKYWNVHFQLAPHIGTSQRLIFTAGFKKVNRVALEFSKMI